MNKNELEFLDKTEKRLLELGYNDDQIAWYISQYVDLMDIQGDLFFNQDEGKKS